MVGSSRKDLQKAWFLTGFFQGPWNIPAVSGRPCHEPWHRTSVLITQLFQCLLLIHRALLYLFHSCRSLVRRLSSKVVYSFWDPFWYSESSEYAVCEDTTDTSCSSLLNTRALEQPALRCLSGWEGPSVMKNLSSGPSKTRSPDLGDWKNLVTGHKDWVN